MGSHSGCCLGNVEFIHSLEPVRIHTNLDPEQMNASINVAIGLMLVPSQISGLHNASQASNEPLVPKAHKLMSAEPSFDDLVSKVVLRDMALKETVIRFRFSKDLQGPILSRTDLESARQPVSNPLTGFFGSEVLDLDEPVSIGFSQKWVSIPQTVPIAEQNRLILLSKTQESSPSPIAPTDRFKRRPQSPRIAHAPFAQTLIPNLSNPW